MRRVLMIIMAIIVSPNLFGQTTEDTVYVVFTSNPDENVNTGVSVASVEDADYRTPVRGYFFVDVHKDYICNFSYFNKKSDPDNPILTKPLSFLSTIEYIDWDAIHPSITKEQANTKFDEIKSHKKIYLIDRREIANGTIKLVPVTYSKTTY